ncbi:Multidrug export protein MepA [Sporotomaculum syntrophicum]|uniref:Multidrug export protein MepA n=1 Tax=Sporotomaculum syntrophicum TaxID=182264 RepID=A0A9D3AXY2_9FIRM|nr:MATE family efflux transporter [Sporotomaculum syntrophicum]KAF1084209.1 Multidrug export protein MepA [Sporotomaculum syntrophicum]
MNKKIDLGNGNINRLLWEFSLPAIIGMSVNALYNLISRIFVGQGVNSLAIAAVTVALPIMTITFAVCMLIGIGGMAMISIRLGEQKKEEANKIAGNAALLLIVLPFLLTCIYFLYSDPLLRLFGATSPEVLLYSRDYIHIIMLGSVPAALGYGLNNFIRAEGNPRFAMFSQIIGAVSSVILNYVFIFTLDMGIKGSALGTVLGQLISTIWVISYFLRGTSQIKITINSMKPQVRIALKIMAIGFAPFAMQIASSVQQTILNQIVLAYGGDLALSAVGIIMSVGMILIMPIVGISQGAQPIIGYNFGAKQYERVKETLKKAIMAGTALAITSYLVIIIFAAPISALFSKGDTALTQLTAHALSIFFAFLPIVGFHIIGANYFQAVGKPVQSTILSSARQVLIFIPALLILPNFWGIEGAWWSSPISDALSVLLTATLLFFEMRNLPQKSNLAS